MLKLGKAIHNDHKSILKLLTYQQLNDLYIKKEIVIPEWQRSIDTNKVNSIETFAKTNANFFIFQTNPIQIINLSNSNGTYNFIIDGQHRLQACINLFNKNGINNYIMLAVTNCANIQEVKQIYETINIETTNMAIPFDEIEKDFKQQSYIKIRKILVEQYKDYFGTNKDKYRYSIDEFVAKLRENKFLEYLTYTDIQETIEYLILENQAFYDEYGYDKIIKHSTDSFYEKEIICIRSKIIFTLRRNNFIDYLFHNDTKPIHEKKLLKKKINKVLREQVWKRDKGTCKLCHKMITDKENEYHCSHIISEYNNGLTELKNLCVLCKQCNLQLGSNNIPL
jgi:hypothetical protein